MDQLEKAALLRVVGTEDRVGDLLAFLMALDPDPLVSVLKLEPDAGRSIAKREVSISGRSGRIDLVIEQDGTTVALLELKMSAGQHGDQLARYEQWAQAENPDMAWFLVGRTPDEPDVPTTDWRTDLTLPMLVAAWSSSKVAEAAWLASNAAEVLGDLCREAPGFPAEATSPVVAHLVMRRLAVLLDADWAERERWIRALGDVGGTRPWWPCCNCRIGTARTSGWASTCAARNRKRRSRPRT